MLHPASLIWRWWFTQWSTTIQDAEKSLEGTSISKWDSCVTPTSKAQGSLQKRGRKSLRASRSECLLWKWTFWSWQCNSTHERMVAKISQQKSQRGPGRDSLGPFPVYGNRGGWSRDAGLRGCSCSSRWPCAHAHIGSIKRIQWVLKECLTKTEHMKLRGKVTKG